MAGFEPATSSLPRKCSTPELHWRFALSGRRGSNSRPSAWKADALSTELLPQKSARPGGQALLFLWAKMDSNHGRYKPADLQSAPFDHSGIRPLFFFIPRQPNSSGRFRVLSLLSLLSDSNQRPRDYKSRALAN